MKTTLYDPNATFEVNIFDVDFRRNVAGRQLKARIYQPQGAGPFPTLLDLHGGAWNGKDRLAEVQRPRLDMTESTEILVVVYSQ